MSSGSSDSSVTFGDLLVNVVRRQQLRMPAADQMQAFEATIDSMLDRGSADLANVFDELSVNLTKAEGNTSRLLSTNLADAQALIAQRLDRLPDDLPGRQEVIDELMALRKAQLERELERARLASSRVVRPTKPVGWWEAQLASGGSMVSLLNGSARWMGVLLMLGIVDYLGGSVGLPGCPIGSGVYISTPDVGNALELRTTLTAAWAIAFGGGLFAYLCALAGVLYSSSLPKVERKALDDPDRRKNS